MFAHVLISRDDCVLLYFIIVRLKKVLEKKEDLNR